MHELKVELEGNQNMEHQHGAGCGCGHGPNVDQLATLYTLYSKIDKEHVECLNESTENSGKSVFKPWDERLLHDKVCGGNFIASNS